jgi:uncharacterized membrane protein
MKKSTLTGTLLVLLISIIPLIYTGSIYSDLPKTIPIHFDINGKPNGYGDKTTLWFLVLFLSALSAGIYLLIKNLPKIDPKKTAGQSPELYQKIAITLVIFLCAINITIVYASVNGSFNLNNILLPLLGLLFLVLGNYMHSIKPNYFVGFRLPWTLENEDNWRKTHQLVSKLWVPGGLAITIGTLLLPTNFGFIFFGVIMMIITIIPIVFSFRYFKKTKSNK